MRNLVNVFDNGQLVIEATMIAVTVMLVAVLINYINEDK